MELLDILTEAHQEVPEWLEGLARETKRDNYSKRNYGGNRRYVGSNEHLSERKILLYLDLAVLALVIIVRLLKYVAVEREVIIVLAVPQVVTIIISNNGMDLTVVPVETCGAVIIKQVMLVATIVINNKLLVVMEIDKQIKVGGTIRHEK